MFKKKEIPRSSLSGQIPARLIKKGVSQDTSALPPSGNRYGGYPHAATRQPFSNVYKPGSYVAKNYNIRGIPEFDVSESYLSKNQQWQQPTSAPSSTKSRRRFAPSFLLRKKKTHDPTRPSYVNVDIEEEDETDIARLEDLTDRGSMDSVVIGHLDDKQLNKASDKNFENVYQRRVEFILSHYQKPPPYPGKHSKAAGGVSANVGGSGGSGGGGGFGNSGGLQQGSIIRASSTPHLESDVDAPLIRQLLKDKQLTDNASMNNFWQAGPPQNERGEAAVDKLVSRTQNPGPNPMVNPTTIDPKELFEKRKQHYNLITINENSQQQHHAGFSPPTDEYNRDTVSEIIYPPKDYEENKLRSQAMNLSASVPNLSMQYTDNMTNPGNFTTPRKPRDRIEPGEMEALIAHYRKTSLDTFEPYGTSTESSSHLEGSSSYVPPSPYMSAEIPDWLQVYAKASADLDHYLKWEMFRYPELDCWQTMLKRLYKKELEQVVMWFEEYRIALCDELDRLEEIQQQQQQQQKQLQQQHQLQQYQQHQHQYQQQQHHQYHPQHHQHVQQHQPQPQRLGNALQLQAQLLNAHSMDDLRKTDV